MQTTLDGTNTLAYGMTANEAQHAAEMYLAHTLGAAYTATNRFYGNGHWYFLICTACPAGGDSHSVGKLAVNAHSGVVVPLTTEQIQDIREATASLMAQTGNQIARDALGYVLRHDARMAATQWLQENLTLHFSAVEGRLVVQEDEHWQFSIRFRLPKVGELQSLGVINVDARTGRVMPLTHQPLQAIRERVRATIEHRQLASAT